MGSKLIFLIVIVLGVIALAQLVRVYELSSKLRNRGEHEVTNRDNNLNGRMMVLFMLLFYAGFIWLMLTYGWTGRGDAASVHGKETDWLLDINFIAPKPMTTTAPIPMIITLLFMILLFNVSN